MKRRNLITILLILSCCFSVALGGRGRNKQQRIDPEPAADESTVDVPDVHFLVNTIGKEIYAYINRPKYKFYIYMTVGTLPDEPSTIALLSTMCNVLYGLSVFFGFLFLPRGQMLVATMLTLYVGPAIILLLLGTVCLSLAAFAMYPVRSVVIMWIGFFLTSQIAQGLGKQLGLDSDKDGDVDMLDLLHWAGTTRWGRFLRLDKLHDKLNDATMDHFQLIHQRLDKINNRIQRDSVILNQSLSLKNTGGEGQSLRDEVVASDSESTS